MSYSYNQRPSSGFDVPSSRSRLPPFSPSRPLNGDDAPNDHPPEYSESDAQALFQPPAPPLSGGLRLPLPLALPQTSSKYDSPFLRAYNQQLEQSGIYQDDWLKFIDGLNCAMTASPPLRIVDIAGGVLGFVPYHWAVIAGAAMQVGARTAAAVVSKTLTDKYLTHANVTYFAPRSMRVRLMKTEAMRRFVESKTMPIPDTRSRFFGADTLRTAHIVGLHLPIAKKIINRLSAPVPNIDPYAPGDVSTRRLEQFDNLILPVSTDVPPPTIPAGLLDRASALAVTMDAAKARKSQMKLDDSRRLLAGQQGNHSYPRKSSQSSIYRGYGDYDVTDPYTGSSRSSSGYAGPSYVNNPPRSFNGPSYGGPGFGGPCVGNPNYREPSKWDLDYPPHSYGTPSYDEAAYDGRGYGDRHRSKSESKDIDKARKRAEKDDEKARKRGGGLLRGAIAELRGGGQQYNYQQSADRSQYYDGQQNDTSQYGNSQHSSPSGQPLLSYKDEQKLQSKVDIANRLEMLKTDGLVWLVLMNADRDTEIEGTELADDLADEKIDGKTWQKAIDEENRDAKGRIDLMQ